MALSQLYSAVAGATITAARWNNEFGNIYGNGTDVAFPVTKAVSFAGFTLTLDVAGVTTLSSSTTQAFILAPGSKTGTPGTNCNMLNLAAGTFQDTNTAASGTASQYNAATIRTPVLSAANTSVTTTAASTLYVEAGPSASTNQTITASYALKLGGMLGTAKGTDVASAGTLPLPPNGNMSDCTGTTTITAIPETQAGTLLSYRFTGAGLNITHHATSMIAPWEVPYRTIPNEILCFLSLGSGNYTFWSLNGPKEQTGQTMTWNAASEAKGGIEEDGTAISRTTYAGLFAKIGTVHGIGDGSTTFNVPDSRGRVDIAVDGSAGVITTASHDGGNADSLGGRGGFETQTLTQAQLPDYALDINQLNGAASGTGTSCVSVSLDNNATINSIGSSGGGGDPHSNTQPWIARRRYIRF